MVLRVGHVGVEVHGSPPVGRRLRHVLVAVFFASVVLNALLGLAALVLGEFSGTHARILGTSLLVTAGLLGALACAPSWERRRVIPVPVVGAAASVLAAALGIVAVWSGGGSDTLGKAMGSVAVLAGGCVLASLLAFASLAPRFRPVLGAALVLDALAVSMLAVTIWAEIDSSLYARAFGVVGVLLAATAVSVPVLTRIGREEPSVSEAPTIGFCPYCGSPVAAAGGEAACSACGRRFSVTTI